MKILSKHILSEWWLAFVIMMFTTTGLLIVEDIYKNLHDFIQNSSFSVRLFWYYFWLIIRVLPTVIPISFFLSLLFSLGKLHKNNEIVVMRVIGLNIFQITLPLWIVGCLLSILTLFLNIHTSSIASQNTQNFCESTKTNTGIVVENHLTFNNERDHRVWFLGTFNKNSISGTNAMLYFYDQANHETSRIFAKIFEFRDSKWIFYDGFETFFDIETNRPSHITNFDRKGYNFQETPDLFFSLTKRTKYLSFSEVDKILSFSRNNKSYLAYRMRYYRSIVSSLSCILIVFIIIPFATIGVRRNPMVGVSKACGILFLFYIISSVFNILGSHGVVSLLASVLTPYGLMILASYSLYKKCI